MNDEVTRDFEYFWVGNKYMVKYCKNCVNK